MDGPKSNSTYVRSMGQYCARPKTVVKHTVVEKIQPAATINCKITKVARLDAETLRWQITSLQVGIRLQNDCQTSEIVSKGLPRYCLEIAHFILLEPICCKKQQKKVILVCEIGDLWRTWLIPNWLYMYMSPSDSPDHPGSILYHWVFRGALFRKPVTVQEPFLRCLTANRL